MYFNLDETQMLREEIKEKQPVVLDWNRSENLPMCTQGLMGRQNQKNTEYARGIMHILTFVHTMNNKDIHHVPAWVATFEITLQHGQVNNFH